jgi:predicted ester cyclase
MSTEQNTALYRRFIEEVANRGNIAVADDILAPEVIEHERLPPGLSPDREGIKALFTMLRRAFPDLAITIEDQVAAGDKVVARVMIRGTHQGALLGIAGDGQR